MSVKIEILDYKYGVGSNMADANQASSGLASGWTALSSTNAAWDGSGSGVTYLSNISSQSLVIGRTYNLSFKIYGYTGTGTMGFAPTSGVPSTAQFAGNTNGVQHFTFVATGTSFPDLFGRSTNTGNISSISITDASAVDWDASVVGELDVTDHSDFPLAMTFQISDFKDLTSTSGDYSKTFKFPATKNNNNILKHLYIPNINSDNDVTERKPCRIMMGDAYTLLGLIRITGTGGYGEVPSYYSGVFYGNNLTWASGLEDAYMNDLDWGVDGEDLEYKQSSIIDTWQDEDCNSNPNSYIVYPITSYGQYNEEGDARTIQLLSQYANYSASYYGYNSAGTFHETPKPVADWRPAVFVKNTLDKLFGSVGYKISSAFMDTAEFKKNVWLLPNFKYNNPDDRVTLYATETSFTNNVDLSVGSSSGLPAIPTEDGVVRIYNGSLDENDGDYYYNGAGRVVLDIDDIFSDPSSYNISVELDNSSNLNFTNDYILVPEYGYYDINLGGLETKVARVYKGGGDDARVEKIWSRVAVEVQTVGHSGSSSWVAIGSSGNEMVINQDVDYNTDANTPYQDISSISIEGQFFNKGDKIRITTGLKITAQNNSQDFLVYIFVKSKGISSFLNLRIDPNNVQYGQTYNLTDVMNPDYKQIDFIKGIAHAYNLQMTTDESTKTVHIEPFDSFYKPYKDAIDWTSKVSRGEEISDKWIQNDLKRDLVFKYKSDSADGKVKLRGERFFDDIEDEYPYRETLPTTFEKGNSTFENPFFAGTYNAKDTNTTGIPNVDTAYSACLWEENYSSNSIGRPDKGFEFLPRLLYWNKYSPASGIVTDKFAIVQTWSTTTKTITANATTNCPSCYLSTIYPQATMVNRDSTTSPNLAYGNAWVRDYDDATGIYTASQTGKGLYDTYYRNMIEMLKINPRLRTISLDLKVSDIINLDFRELVYIDGVYWRINRIVDYMPNNNNTTKVELIEWSQIGIFAASAPTFGSSGGSSSWGTGGSYTQSTSAEAEPPSGF